MQDKKSIVNRRLEFVLFYDVTDGNPNGDPDAGNMPRLDPETRQGIVSDVCIKRKVRNAMYLLGQNQPGYDIYFQTQDAIYEQRILNLQHQRAYDALGIGYEKKKKEKEKGKAGDPLAAAANTISARQWMCQTFFDIRAFGSVMNTGTANCGQVRGPLQITMSRSIDPVLPVDYCITRKSVTKEEDASSQAASDGHITGTFGRKDYIPYGLFRCSGFINPYLAQQTGFTYGDLDLFWQSLKGLMWEIDRSASRGLMTTRGLYVFEHASMLGEAPTQDLFDRISLEPLKDKEAPRTFSQYRNQIKINEKEMPTGVKLHRMVDYSTN